MTCTMDVGVGGGLHDGCERGGGGACLMDVRGEGGGPSRWMWGGVGVRMRGVLAQDLGWSCSTSVCTLTPPTSLMHS